MGERLHDVGRKNIFSISLVINPFAGTTAYIWYWFNTFIINGLRISKLLYIFIQLINFCDSVNEPAHHQLLHFCFFEASRSKLNKNILLMKIYSE